MYLELLASSKELISVGILSIFMAISPGSDFVIVSKNSIFHGRKAGLYSALGISLAIWFHVAYSIAGIAVIISNSIILFSIIKYLGAAYLIYLGYKTFFTTSNDLEDKNKETINITSLKALKIGFITNVFNPKTTIFFLSIFSQLVSVETPLWIQLIYGAIISVAHLLWFILVSYIFSHSLLINKYNKSKKTLERTVGIVLIAFGLKVASLTNE